MRELSSWNNPSISLLLMVLSLLSHCLFVCWFFYYCLGPLSARSDSRYKSFANQLLEFSADLILCYLVTSPGNCYCWQVFWISFLLNWSICSIVKGCWEWVGGRLGDSFWELGCYVVKGSLNETSVGSVYALTQEGEGKYVL